MYVKTCNCCERTLPLSNFRFRLGNGRSSWWTKQCRVCDYQKANNSRDCDNPRYRYNVQKGQAKARGIDWQFSFSSWWSVWRDFWHNRGRSSSQYCMARYGDTGPYSPENVAIITNRENIQRKI